MHNKQMLDITLQQILERCSTHCEHLYGKPSDPEAIMTPRWGDASWWTYNPILRRYLIWVDTANSTPEQVHASICRTIYSRWMRNRKGIQNEAWAS